MWRLGDHLVGQCMYANQEITFIGGNAAKIQRIHIAGKRVRRDSTCLIHAQLRMWLGFVSGSGPFKSARRSGSSRETENGTMRRLSTPSSQICLRNGRKLEPTTLFTSSSFPACSTRNPKSTTRRVLCGATNEEIGTRTFTKSSRISGQPPMEAHPRRASRLLLGFQRDILLTHHYHRASLDKEIGIPSPVRLVGQLHTPTMDRFSKPSISL
jgi:hypothetical protein